MFMGFVGIPFVIAAVVVLLVLAGKSEDDPKRERPAALYLSFLTLVGVLLLLAGTFTAVNGLVELTDTNPSGGWSSYPVFTGSGEVTWDDLQNLHRRGGTVNHDDDVSQLIGGLIIGAVAAALLWFSRPKLQALADNSTGPGARIYSRLLYAVSGVTLLTGLAAAGTALYAVFGMIAPETAGAGRVTDAFRSLITALALTAVSALLFREAWARSEDLAAVVNAPVETPPVPVDKAVKKATRTRKAAPPAE